MWETELKGQPNPNVKNAVGSKENWYNKASEYWEVRQYCFVRLFIYIFIKTAKPTYDGVLGGFGHLNSPDISSSEEFLNYFLNNKIIEADRAIGMHNDLTTSLKNFSVLSRLIK
jgi:hypothetical protein